MLNHMNKNISYFFLLLIVSGIVGCVSYEEGPELSPFPVKYRVVKTWVWAYALENEQNLTGEKGDSIIQFRDDQIVRICDTLDNCREGRWNLVRKKQKLQMIFGEVATAYDIRMLRRDEMWLYYEDPDSDLVIEWELVPR